MGKTKQKNKPNKQQIQENLLNEYSRKLQRNVKVPFDAYNKQSTHTSHVRIVLLY